MMWTINLSLNLSTRRNCWLKHLIRDKCVNICYCMYNCKVMCSCSQECISKSAIQTKFESHAVSGMKITNMVKVLMEQIVGCAFQQRLVRVSVVERCPSWRGNYDDVTLKSPLTV